MQPLSEMFCDSPASRTDAPGDGMKDGLSTRASLRRACETRVSKSPERTSERNSASGATDVTRA
eukprot:scaffold17717_cov112-Isochrysis_galbana.AAC.5